MVINIEEYKTKDGKLDEEKVERLRVEKPIVEKVTEERFRAFSIKLNRDPYIVFPNRLPTAGKLPLPIDEHEHIGMYENNQTLYLTMANAYNILMEKYEALEKRLEDTIIELHNRGKN